MSCFPFKKVTECHFRKSTRTEADEEMQLLLLLSFLTFTTII